MIPGVRHGGVGDVGASVAPSSNMPKLNGVLDKLVYRASSRIRSDALSATIMTAA